MNRFLILNLISLWRSLLFLPLLSGKAILVIKGGKVIANLVGLLVDSNFKLFWNEIYIAILIYFSITVLDSIAIYYTKILAIIWRKELTQIAHTYYCKDNIFYKINDLDNPDQRITNNIKEFTESLSELTHNIIITPLQIILYTVFIFKVLNWILPIIIIYIFFFIGIIIQKIILYRVSKIFNILKEYEGNFRNTHLKMIFNSLHIIENNNVSRNFSLLESNLYYVITVSYSLTFILFILDLFSKFIDYFGSILNYIIIAYVLMIHKIKKSEDAGEMAEIISQASFYILGLISSFSTIINTFDKLSTIYGLHTRVVELFEYLLYDDDEESMLLF